ncbi:hypothetical protein EG347_06525 [Chryseobacterium sp. G0186]|uniref:hypothetical protein n=1 Tax=Chryseobacterium sp. G0186 TaxID=2487064 RepID=UPI000F503E74|nr:hypothetical protein [Chryseobacterium sp. G0186]AZA77181.1 hypothetical protein EG347_06525 [Chryseobacterium sp. G0186]
MTTDSENNMMNQLFSLHLFGGRRFFLFILLLVNFQIVQGISRHSEAPSSDSSPSSSTLFISEGTIVSGAERIYISHPKKEKIKKASKRKNVFISSKRKQKKEENLSQSLKNNNKTVLIFSRDTQSEKALLSASNNNKQIVSPHMMKFILLRSESQSSVLLCLLDIYLKKIHKSDWFSNLRFFQNFNRPPPFLHRAIIA